MTWLVIDSESTIWLNWLDWLIDRRVPGHTAWVASISGSLQAAEWMDLGKMREINLERVTAQPANH